MLGEPVSCRGIMRSRNGSQGNDVFSCSSVVFETIRVLFLGDIFACLIVNS